MSRIPPASLAAAPSFNSPAVFPHTNPDTSPGFQVGTTGLAAQLTAAPGSATFDATENGNTSPSVPQTTEISPAPLLRKALEDRSQDQVSELISTGISLDMSLDSEGLTPLMHATRNGDLMMVKLLLDKGAKVNAQDSKGRNATVYAVRNHQTDALKLLIAAKANLEARDIEGRTTIMHLRPDSLDQSGCIGTLIAAHADFTAKDYNGATVAHHLTRVVNLPPQMIKMHCKSPDTPDNDGNVLQHYGSMHGNIFYTSFLTEPPSAVLNKLGQSQYTLLGQKCQTLTDIPTHEILTSPADKEGRTFFMLASKATFSRDENFSRNDNLLSENFKDSDLMLETRDKSGATALIHAARQGLTAYTNWLLGKGADIHARDQAGMNPLMHACAGGHMDAAETFLQTIHEIITDDYTLEQIAQVEKPLNSTQWASLTSTARTGVAANMLNALKELEHHFGNADLPSLAQTLTLTGQSALTFAVENARMEIVELLLQHGANPAIRTHSGLSLMEIAAKAGHAKVLTLLLDHAASSQRSAKDASGAYLLAASNGHLEALRALEHTAKPNTEDDEGNNALHIAAQNDRSLVIDYLLEFIEINSANHLGHTALIIFSRNGNKEAVSQLLASGADRAHKDKLGFTALDYARIQGHQNIVPLFEVSPVASLEQERI